MDTLPRLLALSLLVAAPVVAFASTAAAQAPVGVRDSGELDTPRPSLTLGASHAPLRLDLDDERPSEQGLQHLRDERSSLSLQLTLATTGMIVGFAGTGVALGAVLVEMVSAVLRGLGTFAGALIGDERSSSSGGPETMITGTLMVGGGLLLLGVVSTVWLVIARAEASSLDARIRALQAGPQVGVAPTPGGATASVTIPL